MFFVKTIFQSKDKVEFVVKACALSSNYVPSYSELFVKVLEVNESLETEGGGV